MRQPFKPLLPSDGLKVLSACPLCDVHYSPLQAHVLDQREDAHLLHLECHNCGGAVVAAVHSDQLGVSSVGLITDLTSDDVIKFKDQLSEVSADDVLGLAALLRSPDHQQLFFSPV